MLSEDDWRAEYLPIVLRNREECAKLLAFWKNEYHYLVDEGIDFSLYDEALLCYGVLSHNSAILKKQIAKGTNPDVYICGSIPPGKGSANDGISYNALEQCSTFYGDIVSVYGFRRFWERDANAIVVDKRDIFDLLQGAAYQQLEWELLGIKQKIN